MTVQFIGNQVLLRSGSVAMSSGCCCEGYCPQPWGTMVATCAPNPDYDSGAPYGFTNDNHLRVLRVGYQYRSADPAFGPLFGPPIVSVTINGINVMGSSAMGSGYIDIDRLTLTDHKITLVVTNECRSVFTLEQDIVCWADKTDLRLTISGVSDSGLIQTLAGVGASGVNITRTLTPTNLSSLNGTWLLPLVACPLNGYPYLYDTGIDSTLIWFEEWDWPEPGTSPPEKITYIYQAEGRLWFRNPFVSWAEAGVFDPGSMGTIDVVLIASSTTMTKMILTERPTGSDPVITYETVPFQPTPPIGKDKVVVLRMDAASLPTGFPLTCVDKNYGIQYATGTGSATQYPFGLSNAPFPNGTAVMNFV